MSHDLLCQMSQPCPSVMHAHAYSWSEERGKHCAWCPALCQCEALAKADARARADERERTTRRAVIETLRYLVNNGTGSWEQEDLIAYAETVEAEPSITTSWCCPFCEEAECDNDCPLRHTRQPPDHTVL